MDRMETVLTQCPACRSDAIETECFVHDAAFVSSATLEARPASPVSLTRISLAVCRGCGVVFNQSFDERQMRRAYTSPSYVVKKVLPGHMSETLAFVAKKIGSYVSPTSVVMEIGSGDGRLAFELSGLCREMITVDPSYASLSCNTPIGNLRHYHDYFGPNVAHDAGQVDMVIARHLIEHLTDPMSFLRLIHEILTPRGILYLETPDFREIMESSRYYDVFNDHVVYYSKDALQNTAARVGFRGLESISLFGGQHCGWFFTKAAPVPSARSSIGPYDFPSLDRRVKEIDDWVENCEGRVAVYGAGAHGVTLWSYLSNGARDRVLGYFDGDPSKENLFIQGTDRQVRLPEADRVRECDAVILAAALYETEIHDMLRRRGYTGQVVRTARRTEAS